MIFGLAPFTWFHTLLSLVALIAGAVALAGLLRGRIERGWTALYLLTAVATSATGFGFPFQRILPSHVLAILSLLLLAASIAALYRFGLEGAWRRIYALGLMVSLYFLLFVLVVQLFAKVPALHALAPTQGEPPFAVAQGVLLAAFVWLGWRTLRRNPATA